MYDFVLQFVENEFTAVTRLKESERGCVSVLRHKVSGRRYVFRSFRGEGQVYQRLLSIRCPNLPQILEVAQRDGNVLVLEEYIQGDDLAELLKGARFTPAEARRIAAQLCAALWTLHSQGVVHRDVKPENIIVRGGEAVLVDFDASRIFKDGVRADTQVLGTTGYAPPEQYGISQTDPRSDIYALGVVLNIMLTGQHPSVVLAPGRLGRVIQRCTMVNPEKRYQNVLALREAL